MQDYFPLILMFVVTGSLVGVILFLASLLGPKKPSLMKNSPFECGYQPFQLPTDRFFIRFYLIAMLFILFDIEVIFLYPWAVVFRELKMFAFVEMFLFIALILVGFFYIWKKGALDWALKIEERE